LSSAVDQDRRIHPTAVQKRFAVFPALVTDLRQPPCSPAAASAAAQLIEAHQLDQDMALAALRQLTDEGQPRDFCTVIIGFHVYSPHELSTLWIHGDRYQPQKWQDQ
jgi:hypothetical protein